MQGPLIDSAIFEEVRELHSDPARGYHAWSHPLALFKQWETVKDRLHDPLAVYCAILFHDVIYEPRAKDNERRSADFAEQRLKEQVPDETLRRTLDLIIATETHTIPEHVTGAEREDVSIFLDMDLSILGAPEDVFDGYEAGVRKEYSEIPEPLFREGRAKILEGFLARERLYFSDWGFASFEAKARENLARSINQLRNVTPP